MIKPKIIFPKLTAALKRPQAIHRPHLDIKGPNFGGVSQKISAARSVVLRFLRMLGYLAIFAIFLTIAGIGSIFYFVTPERVQQELEDTAKTLFAATLEMQAPPTLSRFPEFTIDLPATVLKRNGDVVLSFDAAHFELAHWALLLGAYNVTNVNLRHLQGSISLPTLSTQTLFDAVRQNGTFPNHLHIGNFALTDSQLNLTIVDIAQRYKFSDVSLRLAQLSPEMQSLFDLQCKVRRSTSSDSAQASEGTLSATGTLTVQSAKNRFTIDDLRFAGDRNDSRDSLTASIDRLHAELGEMIVTNAKAMLVQPDHVARKVDFVAVDTRFVPSGFFSPEMRIDFADTVDAIPLALQVKSAVEFDYAKERLTLENLRSTLSLTSKTRPEQPLVSNVSGFVHADCRGRQVEMGLAGDIGQDAFTYRGHLNLSEKPALTGDLMLATFDLSKLSLLSDLGWMRRFDFDGDLRIGQFLLSGVQASQLHGKLKLSNGLATLTDTILNMAEGRLLGRGQLSENSTWSAEGQVDSLNLDRLFSVLAPKSPLGGLASGDIAVTGVGLNREDVKATGKLRMLRSVLRGVDFEAVYSRIIDDQSETPIDKTEATTRFDEAQTQCSMHGVKLQLAPFSARNAGMKMSGNLTLQLNTGELEGVMRTSFAPMHARPSIGIRAALSGKLDHPLWNFDFATAQSDLNRAYGPAGAPKDKQSIWKSLKNFFHF